DFSAGGERMGSVAHRIMAENGRAIPPALVERARAWNASEAKQLFLRAVEALPEDMRAYAEGYERRLQDLLAKAGKAEAKGGLLGFPPYGEDSYRDAGKRFEEQYAGHQS